MNKINKETLNLIKSFEGLELVAYKDAVGVWTIGYGHTSMAGAPKVVPGMKITQAEAEQILLNDIVKYENAVKRLVKVPVNNNQYGALVSWTYNLGEGNLASSTMLKKLNAGDYNSVPSEMMKWNKAGGKVLKGLTRRRKAEGELFNKISVEIPVKPIEKPKEAPSVVEPKKSNTLLDALLALLKAIFGGK